MKRFIVQCLLVLTVLPLAQVACQNTTDTKVGDVTVSNSVLKTSEIFHYKYTEELTKAEAGDYKALMDFLKFSSKLDEADAINHGQTCLELLAVVGDEHFAAAAQIFSVKRKALILDQMVKGQTRTKNEALKKPMQEWAPATWGELNNKPVGHGEEKERRAAGMQQGATPQKPDQFPASETKPQPELIPGQENPVGKGGQ